MLNGKCPVCEFVFEIPEKAKQRITCPNCFAQLSTKKLKGKMRLVCAICEDTIMDPERCANCERKLKHLEKMDITVKSKDFI